MAQVRFEGGFRTSPLTATDRDLVLAFQAGDDQAYDRIYARFRPMARRACLRVLANPEDAEEAAQETMLRVLEALPTFNGRYLLGAWVNRIATNVSLDILRARARRPENGKQLDLEAVEGSAGDDDPGELTERAAEGRTVHDFLDKLPPHHRAALVMREIEGRSHEEIATALSMSRSQVKALIHRAKRTFRREWGIGGRQGLRALIPVFATFRMPGLFRKVLQTSESAAGAAAPAFSSPAMVTATAAGERFTAAVAAIFVGTVGIGTVVANRPGPPERPPAVVVAQAPAEAEASLQPATRPVVREHRPARDVKDAEKTKPDPQAVPEVVPEPTPEPSVEPSPAPELTPPPPPEPSAATDPVPPHPSGFAFGFASDLEAEQGCECGGSPSLSQDASSVNKDGVLSFRVGVTGAAILDAGGTAAWGTDVDASWSGGQNTLSFTATTPDGTSTYDASGSFVERTEEAWGGWTYVFGGRYVRRGGPLEHDSLPQHGSYTLALTFSWQEHRLVEADLSLAEG